MRAENAGQSGAGPQAPETRWVIRRWPSVPSPPALPPPSLGRQRAGQRVFLTRGSSSCCRARRPHPARQPPSAFPGVGPQPRAPGSSPAPAPPPPPRGRSCPNPPPALGSPQSPGRDYLRLCRSCSPQGLSWRRADPCGTLGKRQPQPAGSALQLSSGTQPARRPRPPLALGSRLRAPLPRPGESLRWAGRREPAPPGCGSLNDLGRGRQRPRSGRQAHPGPGDPASRTPELQEVEETRSWKAGDRGDPSAEVSSLPLRAPAQRLLQLLGGAHASILWGNSAELSQDLRTQDPEKVKSHPSNLPPRSLPLDEGGKLEPDRAWLAELSRLVSQGWNSSGVSGSSPLSICVQSRPLGGSSHSRLRTEAEQLLLAKGALPGQSGD
ncbi:formin-like protein 5 [Phyllostomus discolor]|uniref:Formin-like protein 5 n=1 Tax=Phyllostomus discolor TaxID=89673 RepID=A0A7E6E2X4_9CHIR|nr:formin-like protein 5 [Phyllostomus discolor]